MTPSAASRRQPSVAVRVVRGADVGAGRRNGVLREHDDMRRTRLRRGLALLNGIKGPIYINEDPTDLGKILSSGGKP